MRFLGTIASAAPAAVLALLSATATPASADPVVDVDGGDVARDLARDLGRDVARDLARDLGRDLGRDHDLLREVARRAAERVSAVDV
ncbi:hypothetical protein GCM10025787_57340 [Saccharopolyspora rosea]|uniref:Uncharacterized protein n=1 Tax=Saccharopolyspora rosea TaxID=524884 RepID=A0ABW3FQ28_9PSEU